MMTMLEVYRCQQLLAELTTLCVSDMKAFPLACSLLCFWFSPTQADLFEKMQAWPSVAYLNLVLQLHVSICFHTNTAAPCRLGLVCALWRSHGVYPRRTRAACFQVLDCLGDSFEKTVCHGNEFLWRFEPQSSVPLFWLLEFDPRDMSQVTTFFPSWLQPRRSFSPAVRYTLL